MCGRFNLTALPEEIADHFQLSRLPRFDASYNIVPAQKILCIVQLEDKSLKAVNLFWGLVPSWSKDNKNSHHLINARAETVREKPSFRAAFHKRRCLVVATGFYEWAQNLTGKQAFHIHRPDHRLFVFAGLWEHWQYEQQTLYSTTIITIQGGDLMQPIHERMPVIMPPSHYQLWLDPLADETQAYSLLNNSAYHDMITTSVSDYVNNPWHHGPECIQAMPVK
jgi:putative SOS response-associated peptidase YedK